MRLNRDFHELLECFARNDVRYLIIGLEGLKANKGAVGRLQDLADVEALEERA